MKVSAIKTGVVGFWVGRAKAWLTRRITHEAPHPPTSTTDWSIALQNLKERHTSSDPVAAQYAEANIAAGIATLSASHVGLHMVVNISAAHVAAVCSATRDGDPKPYKNAYDLASYRVGGMPSSGASESRKTVDAALPLPAGKTPIDIYFGAMELNGTGVRFYGDFCLVLRDVDAQTVVLDRNSYDLIRTPLREEVEVGPSKDWPQKRVAKALSMSGKWGTSRHAIAAIKVFGAVGFRARLLTTGQISDAVRDDEDYIETLRVGSFGTKDLSEARVTASDSALEAAIDSRRRTTPTPTLESLLWRHRRRTAEQELRKSGVPVRIVTATGRMKG